VTLSNVFPPKPRACKACGKDFSPRMPMQSVCSPRCARKSVQLAKVEERAKVALRKDAAKPRGKWLAECQAIINRYVRLRDRDLPCCSCDRPASWDGQWHASHFRSVGAASGIRFHLWNIWKGCSICNNHLSGNIAGYRPRLLERIGAERLAWLEAQNGVVRYEIDYLKRFKAVMGKRLKRLEKRL
jgi:hypothetical protein